MDKAIFIDVSDVAIRLGVTPATVYRYIEAGIIPAKRLDHRVLIHRADFERWEREGNTPAETGQQTDAALLLEALLGGEIELVIRARKTEKAPLSKSDARFNAKLGRLA